MYIDREKIETILAGKLMTRVTLSQRSGISRQSISTIMRRGTCEPKTVGRIAAGLNVSIEEILKK